jgi:hypothetical protein
MAYKKKLIVLLSLILILALVYALTLIFDPERAASLSSVYTWIDPQLAGNITRIRISEGAGARELFKKNNRWFIAHNEREYPARASRVEDLIGILSKRAAYPERSSSPSSHRRLGVDEDNASGITVFGEDLRSHAEIPLLYLLIGYEDSTGREVYMRKKGQNEVRSAENKIMLYITGSPAFWYDLRLIPESGNGSLDVQDVQRLTVYASLDDTQPEVFSRWNREWVFSGLSVANPDMGKVDAYIRSILYTEGDDFDDTIDSEDPMFNHSKIVMELGDGSVRTIRLSGPDSAERRFAVVSGSEYVYSLSGWAAQRLFRTAADFERQ